METFVYRPEITFEDTNLVGNVYFANFVRWQNECRNDWLKATDFNTYSQVFRGTKRLLVEDVDLQFLDPAGATLGDLVEVAMTIQAIDHQSYRGVFEMRRVPPPETKGGAAILATGHQCFALVEEKNPWRRSPAGQLLPHPTGPAFVLDVPISLDGGRSGTRLDSLALIRLQGKCREKFLAIHAPGILEAVSSAKLALHTNRISYRLFDEADIDPADRIRLEMRMTDLKSRLTVEFTYLLISGQETGMAPRRIASGAQSCAASGGMLTSNMSPASFPPRCFRPSTALPIQISCVPPLKSCSSIRRPITKPWHQIVHPRSKPELPKAAQTAFRALFFRRATAFTSTAIFQVSKQSCARTTSGPERFLGEVF